MFPNMGNLFITLDGSRTSKTRHTLQFSIRYKIILKGMILETSGTLYMKVHEVYGVSKNR